MEMKAGVFGDMKVVIAILIGLLSWSSWTMAEDAAGAESERSRARGRGERMMRRGGSFMAQLKNKYPAETSEIEKLRSSNPDAARQKMRELMRKADDDGMLRNMRRGGKEQHAPEANPTEEQLKMLKSKYPEEFAEYEKVKSSDPEKAQQLLQQLMQKELEAGANGGKNLRDRNRRSVQRICSILKKRYPERYAEIEKKSATDPDAARAELRKLFAESNLNMPGGNRELIYEYQDPKLKNQVPGNWRAPRNFPFGGGMMAPPGNWGRRR